MHPENNNIIILARAALLVLVFLSSGCNGFASSSSRRKSSRLHYATTATGLDHQTLEDNNKSQPPPQQQKPKWIPMELVELVCEDSSSEHHDDIQKITPQEFISTYADIEAYTSCDDDGDEFHECDFFHQFLGPTKWVHLTARAEEVIDDVHYMIWKDVWENPTQAVDLADKVSKECLRYYKEFMLEPRTAVKCPTDRPVIRVKVVPASYGLEGFEDAVWEATEDLLTYTLPSPSSSSSSRAEERYHSRSNNDSAENEEEECCRAITFVVAAPDLFTDPSLLEGTSPQAEFEPERFQDFSSTLREKMVMFSIMEGVPLDDTVQLTPFHPLWKFVGNDDDSKSGGGAGSSSSVMMMGDNDACQSFPYPCVAVSAKVEA